VGIARLHVNQNAEQPGSRRIRAWQRVMEWPTRKGSLPTRTLARLATVMDAATTMVNFTRSVLMLARLQLAGSSRTGAYMSLPVVLPVAIDGGTRCEEIGACTTVLKKLG
jgi:hypothetical protein